MNAYLPLSSINICTFMMPLDRKLPLTSETILHSASIAGLWYLRGTFIHYLDRRTERSLMFLWINLSCKTLSPVMKRGVDICAPLHPWSPNLRQMFLLMRPDIKPENQFRILSIFHVLQKKVTLFLCLLIFPFFGRSFCLFLSCDQCNSAVNFTRP